MNPNGMLFSYGYNSLYSCGYCQALVEYIFYVLE